MPEFVHLWISWCHVFPGRLCAVMLFRYHKVISCYLEVSLDVYSRISVVAYWHLTSRLDIWHQHLIFDVISWHLTFYLDICRGILTFDVISLYMTSSFYVIIWSDSSFHFLVSVRSEVTSEDRSPLVPSGMENLLVKLDTALVLKIDTVFSKFNETRPIFRKVISKWLD